jgi:hypothetical protein
VKNYDPAIAPDPVVWLELDEQERISLAERYHKATKVKLPNLTVHAVVHVIVENQIAEGVPSTVKAIARLMTEGLSRHDALHAIGAVVAEYFFAAVNDKDGNYVNTVQARVDAAVERLTVKVWKKRYG